jgi:superfamily II RNA helicase
MAMALLKDYLPKPGETLSADDLLDRFLEFTTSKGLTLYPAQEEAILELYAGNNVILNTPTGSGKSWVALALHFEALARGRVSVYTCPIKALVNEKFLNLCRELGAENIGMSTGDATVNRDAPIICCTAEILANRALREGAGLLVQDVIMDEFHYYSDRDRGAAWQIPLLTLPYTRFLLMSATLGDVDFFAEQMTALNGKPTQVIQTMDRPVPLSYTYSENPLHETISELLKNGRSPVYLVNFSQREAAEQAQNLLSVDFCSKEEKRAILEELQGFEFRSPYGKELQRFLKHGVGLHHAGLLPKYRILVERLAQKGLLKIISGTDTLGVGVNVPIRAVLLTKLCKYDGEKTALLSVRDFQQISGRAGRKGFDNEGFVVAQAPEHIIENLRMEQKAKADPKKSKKMVKKTPPPKGFVIWSGDTFNKLVGGKPESLISRFEINHAMLIHVLSRDARGDFAAHGETAAQALRQMIRTSHGDDKEKRKQIKKSFTLFRALLDRGIVEWAKDGSGRTRIRVNVDLQEDFSLNQSLSLYLLDTLKLLDPASPTYALDVLTLVESILESPDLILRKQLDKVKTLKMSEMKAAGMEYEERMEELEKLEYPKPLREFIYQTFNEFSDKHPWIGTENIRPKSIAREMYEGFYSFAEYIREYELGRAEGILLRYLSDCYKALVQTVPDSFKTPEVEEISFYLKSLITDTDASLVQEWERILRGGSAVDGKISSASAEPVQEKVTDKDLTVWLRNQVFRFIRAVSIRDFEAALQLIENTGETVWTTTSLDESFQEYFAENAPSSYGSAIRTDPAARATDLTQIKRETDAWEIEQILLDPKEDKGWYLRFHLNTEKSREEKRAVLTFDGLMRL